MTALRLVFAGTPDFACPSLEALVAAGHEIALVVTQPDRPRGRGMHLAPPAVKMAAERLGLEVAQPAEIDTLEFRRKMEELAPDATIVVAFGQKIPSWMLTMTRLGCLNVHASLLPFYRGAAPIQRALLNGERETGVTIMRLDEGWDTGPILAQETVGIGPDENAGSLHGRLADAGARLLVSALGGLAAGTLEPRPQDDSLATKAPKVRPEEMRISLLLPAAKLHNLIRALSPAPLAETFYAGSRLQIVKARLADTAADAAPGTVLAAGREGILVQTGQGGLLIEEIKPANGRIMPAAAYARGHRLAPGERLA